MNGGARDNRVWLNCSQVGLGVTAWIHPDDADDLADRLHEWAAQARRGG